MLELSRPWALLVVLLPWWMPCVAGANEAFVWPSAIQRLELQFGSSDAQVRRRAALDLERLPREVQLRLLPGLLNGPDVEVRLIAADAALSARLPNAGSLVSRWLNHADARVREAGARVLSQFPHDNSVDALGRVLGDSAAGVRAQAANALGAAQSARGTSFLLGRLDDTDPSVREAVIRALEELGDARAVVPLIGRIQDPRAKIRSRAARALGSLGDARAAGALTVALGDGDADVRAAAARALGDVGAAEATWSMRALLASEPDQDVREAIVAALGRLGTASSCRAIVEGLAGAQVPSGAAERALVRAGSVAVPALRECVFQDGEEPVIRVCVRALGRIGGVASQQLVVTALRRRVVSPSVALKALGELGQEESLPVVLEYLSSPQPDERRAALDAARALLRSGRTLGLAVEPIVAALQRARGRRLEQAALIRLLGETRSPRAAPALVPLARSRHAHHRTLALDALGKLGSSASDGVLLEALDAELFAIRWTAAIALRKVGGLSSLRPLIRRLETGTREDAPLVALAMAGPASRGAAASQVSAIVDRARSVDGPLRDRLVDAISKASGATGSEPLTRLAVGASAATRAKVAEALAEHPEAVEFLRHLARDREARVRANAVWSLGHVGTPGDLERLQTAARDVDVAVAANAIAALVRLYAREPGLQAVATTLCRALSDARSYVVVNALVGLQQVEQPCEDAAARSAELLRHHASEHVRAAAARLLHHRAAWAELSADRLAHCARKDPSGRVAAACRGGARSPDVAREPELSRNWVSVLVHEGGADEPTAEAPYSLVLTDGLIRSGRADRNGCVTETGVQHGELRLLLPAPFAN